MILAVNGDNKEVEVGLIENKTGKILFKFSLAKDSLGTSFEIENTIRSILNNKGFKTDAIKGSILSSVIPSKTKDLIDALKRIGLSEPLLVGPGLKSGLSIRTDNPRELGSDRIVNAVAAYKEEKTELLVVNFTSVVTICHIDGGGNYQGGLILPSLKSMAKALRQENSKLMEVEIERPNKLIGKNTQESLKSGLIYSFETMVEEMIKKVKNETNKALVIATGKDYDEDLFKIPSIDKVDYDLTLKGLKIIYDKNK